MALSYAWNRLTAKARLLRDKFSRPLLCSNCFHDHGLALEAYKLGRLSRGKCPNCNSRNGTKLNMAAIDSLERNFFYLWKLS